MDICQADKSLNETCKSESCDSCGLNEHYCMRCISGKVNMDGTCIDSCPSGYFDYSGTCYKCNPICRDCEGTANSCISCNLDGDHTQFMFDTGTQFCYNTCPQGSFKSTETVCEPCLDECHTCTNSESCTSCFYHKQTLVDMYLQDNMCTDSCDFGSQAMLETHTCEEKTYSIISWPPHMLIICLILAVIIV